VLYEYVGIFVRLAWNLLTYPFTQCFLYC